MSTSSVAPLELADLFEHMDRPAMEGLDWVGVVHADGGSGGYDWDEFGVWYSPSARRYFWTSGSGCSCNTLASNLYRPDDFESGSKADAVAAGNRFCDELQRSGSVTLSANLSAAIYAFRAPRTR